MKHAKLYLFVSIYFTANFISSLRADAVEDSVRLDCQLDYDEIDEDSCSQRGCIWNVDKNNGEEIPICFLNLPKVGYHLTDASLTGKPLDLKLKNEIQLELINSSRLSAPKFQLIDKLTLKFIPISENILRFQIVDPNNPKRYEVPIQNTFPLLSHKQNLSKFDYSVQIGSNAPFGFKVTRNDNQDVVWDSTFGGGLMYSDQFLQIATRLSTKLLYGMGENTHQTYDLKLNYKTWPLFAFDQPPDDLERNAYGVHPFLMLLEPKKGTANGIFFLNSNAMEYYTTPDPTFTYRTSGGILDFFLFMGKNPEDVVQQYLSLIGRPMMPPFWGLGFQLSRYGYKNTAQVQRVIERNKKYNIPVDVHYVDIDYMNVFDDFTYDHQNFSGLPALVEQTKKDMDLKWVFIIDAAIQANDKNYKPFVEGYEKDLFVNWDSSIPKKDRKGPRDAPEDKNVFYGRVWPRGPSSFPDFFKNATVIWLEEQLKKFYNELKFDGIWIDMNEPANFDNNYEVCPTKNCFMSECPKNKWDYPDARLKAVWVHNRTEATNVRRLSYRTLCLATRQGEKSEFLHYDVHSLYALTEAMATNKALSDILKRRSLILSRSSYVTAGRYTAHWTGDNTSKWSHLQRSVLQMLEFNLFGIPWVGADICGFQENTTPELCLRWSQLGAFYPFSRNHNDIPNKVDQDPGVWAEYGHPEVTKAAAASLQFRYEHLHYYYTLFYLAHTKGQTVIRPLLHEFPSDKSTYNSNECFMVGSSILVAPFLYENQHRMTIYLPNETWWYDTNDDSKYKQGTTLVEDSQAVAPVFFRADSIIPVAITTEPIRNTKHLRKLPLRLNIYPSENSSVAIGQLYWDDGESLNSVADKKYNLYKFEMVNHDLISVTAEHSGYSAETIVVDEIRIYAPVAVNDSSNRHVLGWTDGTNKKEINATVAKRHVTFSGLHFNLTSLETGKQVKFSCSKVPL